MRESGRSLITPTLPFDKLFCFLPNHIRFYVCRSGYYKFRLSIFPTPLQRRTPDSILPITQLRFEAFLVGTTDFPIEANWRTVCGNARGWGTL